MMVIVNYIFTFGCTRKSISFPTNRHDCIKALGCVSEIPHPYQNQNTIYSNIYFYHNEFRISTGPESLHSIFIFYY